MINLALHMECVHAPCVFCEVPVILSTQGCESKVVIVCTNIFSKLVRVIIGACKQLLKSIRHRVIHKRDLPARAAKIWRL